MSRDYSSWWAWRDCDPGREGATEREAFDEFVAHHNLVEHMQQDRSFDPIVRTGRSINIDARVCGDDVLSRFYENLAESVGSDDPEYDGWIADLDKLTKMDYDELSESLTKCLYAFLAKRKLEWPLFQALEEVNSYDLRKGETPG